MDPITVRIIYWKMDIKKEKKCFYNFTSSKVVGQFARIRIILWNNLSASTIF